MNLESIDLTQSSAHVPRLEETITLLDNLLRQIRQISLDLHPSLLDDLGLVPALRSLLDQRASRAGLRAQLFAREALGRVDPGIQNTAFRIAQEAITNVLRHAKAQSIRLYLQHNRDQLRMKIVDDGIGFNPRRAGVKPVARENGFGLLSMRERAGLAGGRMEIVSAPNKGTSIEVVLPLNVPDEKP
jgi:two-component system sensor histidine kinase UhpB